MRRNRKESIQFIKEIYRQHEAYWKDKKPSMKRLLDVYLCRFWDDQDNPDQLVQVPDARNQVESYISSLFSKAPSVVIGGDVQASKGSVPRAEAVVNRFLEGQAQTVTEACRMALIFPCSYLVLRPSDSVDVLGRLELEALRPWDVIVDRSSKDWNGQRWVGRISQIPVASASEIYGDHDWIGEQHVDYLAGNPTPAMKRDRKPIIDGEYLFVVIVELWDMLAGKKIIWTPSVKTNDGYIKVVDAVLDENGRMLIPVIPIYLHTNPESPLEGFSFLSTIYSQIKEKNLLRSHMQNAVRRDSRQYMYQKGSIDEEALAHLKMGADMTFIGVDNLDGLIVVPTVPLSNNYDKYGALIEADIERANSMASFSRGQSTGITATEISALAQYTQSEVGKLARIRDTSIELIARIYLAMLSKFVDDEESVVLVVDGKPAILTATDLEGRFKITAVDQGSLPISQAAKEAKLLSVAPLLLQLGVPKKTMLKELVMTFQLDPSILDSVPDEEPAPAPPAAPAQTPANPAASQMAGQPVI